jgi:hypothetical protein
VACASEPPPLFSFYQVNEKLASRKGRHSSLESRPDRDQILALLARKVPIKVICAQFPVSKDTLYRWITANRPREDRENRIALRKLKKTVAASMPADQTRNWPTTDGEVLPAKLNQLEHQRQTLVAIQAAALRTGNLRDATVVSDTISRNIRHSAALAELMRVRQQINFKNSPDYERLKEMLLQGPPEVVKLNAKILETFETESPMDACQRVVAAMDSQEKLY